METCSICYEEKKLIQTKCNHFFCRTCQRWTQKNTKCPYCRIPLFLNVEKDFILFLKENQYKNISTTVIIEYFVFYYIGIYKETFSSIQYIFHFIEENDKKEYNFQNIIDTIERKYHQRYLFFIFF